MTFSELFKTLDDHQAASQDLVHSFAALEQHQQDMSHLLAEFETDFNQFHDFDPTPVIAPAVEALHSMSADADHHGQQVHDAMTALAHQAEQAGTTLHQSQAAFDAEDQKLLTSSHSLEGEVNGIGQLATDLSHRMDQLQSKLDTAIQHGDQVATQSLDHVTTAAGSLETKIHGEFTQSAATDFGQLSDQVGHQDVSHIEQTYQAVQGNVTHAHGGLDQTTTPDGQQLETGGSHSLNDLEQNILQKLLDEEVHEFEALVKEAAEDYSHQVEELLATMIIGEDVTVALTPILPELKAAELATHALVELTNSN